MTFLPPRCRTACLALAATTVFSAALLTYGGAAPTDSLVSYWTFENDVDDHASAGVATDNGSWVGTSEFGAGPFGNAAILDGATYISVPDSSDVERAGSDMTLSTWLRVDAFDKSWQCLVAKGEGSKWRVHRRSGDANQMAFAGGSGDISGGSVNDGSWHHLVAVSEAGVSTRLIIDGVHVATGNGPGIDSSTKPMMIGENPDATNRQWKGGIDDLGIFSTALNNPQAIAIYTLATDSEHLYDLGQVNQILAAHTGGAGSTVTVGATNWEYVASDPADGRTFIQLGTDGSGMAGSTGPVIRSFVADHPLLPSGAPLALSWDVGADATTLTIDEGIGIVHSQTTGGIGDITLTPGPAANTTYTLTASNAAGTNVKTVDVEVTADPIIEFFTSSQTIVPPDTTVTLNWNVLNATGLTLNGGDVFGSSTVDVTPPATTTYTLAASNAAGNSSAEITVTVIIPGEPIISEFSAANSGPLVDEDGDTSDWIEIHNPSASTAILHDYYLTDDPDDLTKWRLPDMTLDPLGYFVVFASGKDRAVAGGELHTNFSLRASGEYLALTKTAGTTTTILTEFDPYSSQFDGISYGFNPDAVTEAYFTSPTPGAANGTGLEGYVRDTAFAPDRGFYDAPFDVTITSATPGAQIRYTTNGTDPSPSSGTLYAGPINLTTTTTLKAIAYKAGSIPTNVDTHTYIFLDDVLQQPANPPGFPSGTDYGMDPDVVNNPLYSGTIKDDLKTIPSISIVMLTDHLFGGNGIYTNATQSGVAWERPGSVELIEPDGGNGHQINCGVRMQGGVGRNSSFPKHSFRLLFKREYGNTKLNYPLFKDAPWHGDSAVESFDSIILRSGFNNTWHRGSSGEEMRAQYLRDQFIHDSQLAMGHASCHGIFVHLYLNGLYWGVYNVVERPNADFGSSYYGGEKEEWDALNSYPRNVVDGTADAWVTAHSIANAGVADQAGYDALSEYVDIRNLIDYMMLNFYGGNRDWDDHNWYAGRWRLPGEGYKFFCWDAERTLESITGDNRTGVGQSSKPSRFYSQLRANPEFNLEFADRAHRHIFNGGALTPIRTIDRYRVLANEIDRAIVGESARWGDSKRAAPYTRDAEWVTERDRLLTQYLPQRTGVVLSQLRGASLYPGTDAPVFSQHGGRFSSATELTMSRNSGIIYYTTDGSDPRLPGGVVSGAASAYSGSVATTTLVPTGATWKYLDDGTDQGTAWFGTGFNDSAWSSGSAELGYGDGSEGTVVSFGVAPLNKHRTTYFRHNFSVTNPSQYAALSLELQRDDGAIVYLNGIEVMRSNMPGGAVNYLTEAPGPVRPDDETDFHSQSVSASMLATGTNTIAVEVHQVSATSPDLSFDLRLRATPPNATTPILLGSTSTVNARALNGVEWSALNSATFIVDAVPASDANLVISEIHYRPQSPTPVEEAAGFTERSDFEFVELMNIGTVDIDLTNVRFTNGISFNFSDSDLGVILAPGARVLLVNRRAAFVARYPSVPASVIAGEFSGNLDNGGERIELETADNAEIRDMTYDDKAPWPESPDGDGFSLVLIAPQANPDHDEPSSWRASVAHGGTPAGTDASGFAGGDPAADDDDDGLEALLEHALGSSDNLNGDGLPPTIGADLIDLGGGAGPQAFLTLTFGRNLAADDVIYRIEISDDLIVWSPAGGDISFLSRTNHGDGTTTEIYRATTPSSSGQRQFVRLTVIER